MSSRQHALRRAPRPLRGRVVAISGGARGLGLAMGQALAERGCRVALGDLDGDLAAAEASALAGPGPHHGGSLDVTSRESFAAFLDEVERTLGPLDVLVNNAGIMPIGPFAEEDPAVSRRQVEINVLGVITGTQLALDRMLPRRTGHVVNIASAAGKVGLPHEATYCATKHAVVGLGDALWFELHGTGVDITTVCPNLADTELAAGMRTSRGMRLVRPREVAEVVVSCLERPRAEVTVPTWLGGLLKPQSIMPPRMRLAMARLFGTDRIAVGYDAGARASYVERTSGAAGIAGRDPDVAGRTS